MPTALAEGSPTMVESIQSIFTGAAGQVGGMMVPILTAGVVIALGILAFTVGKRLLNKSVK